MPSKDLEIESDLEEYFADYIDEEAKISDEMGKKKKRKRRNKKKKPKNGEENEDSDEKANEPYVNTEKISLFESNSGKITNLEFLNDEPNSN